MAQREKFVGVQVLRGAAAILVTLHHFCLTTVNYGTPSEFPAVEFMAEWGQSGVDIFFCISGFVMLVAANRNAGRGFDPIDFIGRRAIRIYPLYWIATSLFIALILALNTIKLGTHAAMNLPLFAAEYIAKSYLLWPAENPVDGSVMPILAQGWTLTYELYFYLFVSLFAWKFRKPSSAVFAISAAMISACLIGSELFSSKAARYFLSNPIFLEFILGACVFLVTRKYRPAGGVLLAVGVALLLTGSYLGNGRVVSWGVPSAMILYGVVSIEGKFRYPAMLVLIGNASYSLYLTHGFLTYVYGSALKRGFFGQPLHQGIAIAAGTALAILTSIVFYILVERRMTDRLNDLYRRTLARAPLRERPAS